MASIKNKWRGIQMKIRLLLLFTLLYVFPVFAADIPEMTLVGRWPHGPAGPVIGDADRNLVFVGTGSVLTILDNKLTKVSQFVTSSKITSLVSDSNRIYLGNKEKVMSIDVNDPEHPALLGEYLLPSISVAVDGNNLYSLGYEGVTVFDISTPGAINRTGFIEENSILAPNNKYRSGKIAVENNFLYMLPNINTNKFVIYDVSNPSELILESSTEIAANDFQISGLNAYLVNGNGLDVLDISNPKVPVKITEKTSEVANSPYKIFISGQFAYIGCTWGNTWILDISTPSLPVKTGLLPTYTTIGIYVAKNRAYASTWGEGLWAYDVTDPTNGFYTLKQVSDVQVTETVAHVLCNDELEILDYSEAGTLKTLSRFPVKESYGSPKLRRFGNHLFVVSQQYGGDKTIVSIDVSNPSLPLDQGLATHKIENSFYLLDAAFSENLAILGTDAGTFAFDFTDKNQLKELSKLSDGAASEILIHENHVYLREYFNSQPSGTLKIVNISNPSQPINVSFNSPNNVQDLELVGNQLHVLTSDTLYIYDISNPENITESGSYPISGIFNDLQIRETTVYLSTSTEMHIYDLSDPSNLNFVASWRSLAPRNKFKMGNQKAFFAGSKGLQVFSTSAPGNYSSPLFFETPDTISHIDLSNNYIYAVDGIIRMEGSGPKGFHIIDITDKEKPEEKSYYKYESKYNNPEIIKIQNEHAFGLSGSHLKIISISDPLKPVEIDQDFDPQKSLGTFMTGFEVYKDECFISRGGSEIEVIDGSDLSKPVLSDPIPGNSMIVSGTLGYVIHGSILNILDISTPEKPTIGSIELNNEILQAHVNNRYACVVSEIEGSEKTDVSPPVISLDLKILDVSDPAHPVVAGTCVISEIKKYSNQFRYLKNIRLQMGEKYVYLSDKHEANGIRIIDIKNPQTPHEASRLKTIGQPEDIIFSEGYLYVAEGTDGISIFKNQDATPATDGSDGGSGCFINSLIHD
ncbi:MAG: hypothetical protein JEZ12_13850 [Desulfobacterium sp.]|nr:hypothetical protein [Desulfobacterium sp.]